MSRTTNTYVTRDEAIQREIIPLLGEWVDDFDVEGLADELIQSGVIFVDPDDRYGQFRYWVEVPGGDDNLGAVLVEHCTDPDTAAGA